MAKKKESQLGEAIEELAQAEKKNKDIDDHGHIAMGWHKDKSGEWHVMSFKYNDAGESKLVSKESFGTFRAKALMHFKKQAFFKGLIP